MKIIAINRQANPAPNNNVVSDVIIKYIDTRHKNTEQIELSVFIFVLVLILSIHEYKNRALTNPI